MQTIVLVDLFEYYHLMQVNLKGKTALVTGSLSGIGLGIARALCASGANMILNGFASK